jgi:hypothetical protein
MHRPTTARDGAALAFDRPTRGVARAAAGADAGFGILPLRRVLLAVMPNPMLVVAGQVLDGVTAACFGAMVPLVTSDIASRSART